MTTKVDRIWDVVERADVCMLTTSFAGGLRARPLSPRPNRKAGVIWFVTDVRSGKVQEIEAEHDVGFVIVDEREEAYLSISGCARLLDDHAQARKIWRETDAVWWSGPDDPNIRVIRVEPRVAELWDGPSSKIVTIYELGKALLTGLPADLGENRKVSVDMR